MFTLYHADCIGQAGNCLYPHKVEVTDTDSLERAVSRDYVCAEYEGFYRSNDNFLGSNCLSVECDNDHSDNPADWKTPDDIADAFPGVEFAVHYSRNHMKVKNGSIWHPQTIAKMLRNYCYTGNLLLQTTFCENHITKRMLKNTGQRPRYLAEETHEAIIPMEQWQAVQYEIERRSKLHTFTPPAKPTFFYTGLIQCAKCGKNYRRKTTATRVVWICATFNTRGKKYCASKQIPESTLDTLVAEVTKKPTDIQKIIADDGNTLHFHLADGSVVTRIWADRSRAESWTAEKRQSARQQAYERRQTGWQEQSQ